MKADDAAIEFPDENTDAFCGRILGLDGATLVDAHVIPEHEVGEPTPVNQDGAAPPSEEATVTADSYGAETSLVATLEEPSLSPDAPVSSVHEAGLWDEPSPVKRRELPRKAMAFAGAAFVLLLLPLVFGGRKPVVQRESGAEKVPDDLIVNESDLKNRIEVSPDDFRPRLSRASFVSAAAEHASETAPPLDQVDGGAASADSLGDRRARRANDPEDLIAHRGHGGASSGESSTDSSAASAEPKSDEHRRAFIYLAQSSSSESGSTDASGAIVPAGTVVQAVLSTPVDLGTGGGVATLIAVTDGQGLVPKGTRFVGSASPDGQDRVALRFSRLLLPDGREANIEGEAQDASGRFGLEASVASEGGSTSSGESTGSIARDIAADTARDVATNTIDNFTGGILGSVAGNIIYRASAARRGGVAFGRPERRISLAAGLRFRVFLHQAVVIRK